MAVIAKLGWKVIGGITGAVTTMATRKILNAAWTRSKGGQPPVNPEQRNVSWPEALSWTLASTAGMAVSRLVTQRVAAGAWEKATGSLPPGLETPPELPQQ